MSDEFDPTAEEPEEPQIGEPSLESLTEMGAVESGAEVIGPEWVKKPADEPPLASSYEGFSWNKPASKGGDLYPGRPAPSGMVAWGESVDAPTREYPIVRNCSWDEATYVRHEVEVTKTQLDDGRIRGSYTDQNGKLVNDYESRLRRCERYARWRYRGFLAGQIASL